MADGYSRVLNQPGVCIAQNGPGISNFVTGVAAAYWAHSPVVVITPETGSLTNGLGGFQVGSWIIPIMIMCNFHWHSLLSY